MSLLTSLAEAKADGLKNAGFLTVDKAFCGIQVPQDSIDSEVIAGMSENHLSYDQAIDFTVVYGTRIYNYLNGKKELGKYCAARRAST